MQFHEEKNNDLFDFMSFFAWTFLKFLARCATIDIERELNRTGNDAHAAYLSIN